MIIRDVPGQRVWESRNSLIRIALSIVHNGTDAEDAVFEAMVRSMTNIGRLRSEDKLKQ